MMDLRKIESAYSDARNRYAQFNVDTDEAIRKLDSIQLSLHCWQGDDVAGFEHPDSSLSGGGIEVTGNYPGRARTIAELREDIEKVCSLLPGMQRLNLHAIYGDFGGKKVDRDQIGVEHFQSWIHWGKERGIGLDFNPTCFSHPFAADGFTLSSKDRRRREFWIEHVRRSRMIAAEMGRAMGNPSVNNIWIPDGSKDTPVDRFTHRALLKEALDEIFRENFPKEHLIDSLEGKLFGIGSESMVVGSHEFYLGYAARNGKYVCVDTGHYHPTEEIGDKISSILQFVDGIMLHVSRGVRWDSDHVVILNDQVRLLAEEIVRAKALDRVRVGLDFFDASINRIGAYVVGARATQTAFLCALLEPTEILRTYEEEGKYFERLALLEAMKAMPFGAVYDYYCAAQNVPAGAEYVAEVQKYEAEVLAGRGGM